MEIFWDRLGWAAGRPDVRDRAAADRAGVGGVALSRVLAHRAVGRRARPSVRTTSLDGTAPRWLDLEGYYTRFGDVRELLLARRRPLRDHERRRRAARCAFPRRRSPAPGMVRDFVMITDGWEKDGDFNTAFSRTVLPLPTHASGRLRPRHPAARGRSGLPAAPERLRDVPHALRDAGRRARRARPANEDDPGR